MGAQITDWGTMEYKPDGKGQTMFSLFAADSNYFKGSTERFRVNLRADDVAALIEKAAQR